MNLKDFRKLSNDNNVLKLCPSFKPGKLKSMLNILHFYYSEIESHALFKTLSDRSLRCKNRCWLELP